MNLRKVNTMQKDQDKDRHTLPWIIRVMRCIRRSLRELAGILHWSWQIMSNLQKLLTVLIILGALRLTPYGTDFIESIRWRAQPIDDGNVSNFLRFLKGTPRVLQMLQGQPIRPFSGLDLSSIPIDALPAEPVFSEPPSEPISSEPLSEPISSGLQGQASFASVDPTPPRPWRSTIRVSHPFFRSS